MKVTTEKLEKSQVALQVEVEPEILEQTLQRAYRRLVNRTQIPGFRKGKAPRALLERHLGHEALLHEALEILVPEAYEQALKDETIPAIGHPEIELIQTEPSVSFKATVAVEPSVGVGDYKNLTFTLETDEVQDEQVNEVLEQLRAGYAPWEDTEDPLTRTDKVTIKLDSHVIDGENRPTFVERDSVSLSLGEDSEDPVPGFLEQLLGTKKGDTKEFDLVVPEEYEDTPLAGKTIQFEVSILEAQRPQTFELNDEFAKTVGNGYETLDALKDQIRTDLKTRAEREKRDALEVEILDSLVETATVEYPDILVEHEIEHLMQTDNSIPRDPQGRVDSYLASVGKSPEEFVESYREEAAKRVLRSLVLEKVTELEEIEVSEEDIDAEIESLLTNAGEQGETLRGWFNLPERRTSLQSTLIRRKTMERIIDLTTQTVEVEAAAKAKAPAKKTTKEDEETAADSPEPSKPTRTRTSRAKKD